MTIATPGPYRDPWATRDRRAGATIPGSIGAIGAAPPTIDLHLVEGDTLAFTLEAEQSTTGSPPTPIPTPATLWVGGLTFHGMPTDDGLSVGFVLSPEDVRGVLATGARRGQIDAGQTVTVFVKIITHVTPRTDD